MVTKQVHLYLLSPFQVSRFLTVDFCLYCRTVTIGWHCHNSWHQCTHNGWVAEATTSHNSWLKSFKLGFIAREILQSGGTRIFSMVFVRLSGHSKQHVIRGSIHNTSSYFEWHLTWFCLLFVSSIKHFLITTA